MYNLSSDAHTLRFITHFIFAPPKNLIKMNGTLVAFICALVLFGTIMLNVTDEVEATVIEVGENMEYQTISAAVADASDGDIILIHDGIYRENVLVDKSVELRGQNRSGAVIDGIGGTYGISLDAVDINLNDLKITNSSVGVHVRGDNVTIERCVVDDTDNGIFLDDPFGSEITDTHISNASDGIFLRNSQHTILSNISVIQPYSRGIRLVDSSDTIVANVTVIDAGYHPVYISRSEYIILENCHLSGEHGVVMYHSKYIELSNSHISKGVGIEGDLPENFDSHRIHNNTVDSGELHYLKNRVDVKINEIRGQVILINVSESIVSHVSSSDTEAGILLAYSRDNILMGNTLDDNFQGIVFYRSRYNLIHHNNFINNTRQIYSSDNSSMDNDWTDALGGGNYWSDYQGTDQDEDTVGDTTVPHPLEDRGGGYYQLDPEPLMNTTKSVNTSIALRNGWNFISVGSVLPISDIYDVLISVNGSYDKVLLWDASTQGWQSYVPGRAQHFNSLTTIRRDTGFWIHMTDQMNLTLHGVTPARTQISLHDGWNMVGIPSTHVLSWEELPDEVSLVGRFNESREYMLEYVDISEIDYIPNNGYWLKIESDGSVVWTVVWDKT